MQRACAVPSLLFRQYCLLAGAGGVAATREPAAALAFLAVLACLNIPKPQGRKRATALLLCFCLAAGYTLWRAPQPPPVPAWLAAAAAPTLSSTNDRRPPAPVNIIGTVRSVDPLPDNRLRLILDDSRPADDFTAAPYAGGLMVTLNEPTARPLKGMQARLGLRLAFPHSYANPQLPDRERRYQVQAGLKPPPKTESFDLIIDLRQIRNFGPLYAGPPASKMTMKGLDLLP